MCVDIVSQAMMLISDAKQPKSKGENGPVETGLTRLATAEPLEKKKKIFKTSP